MIKFDHVSKTYPNGVKGLVDINLTINDGDFVSIIGLSGAGKSTLLRAINRLNTTTEGEITIDGQSVTHANKNQLKKIRCSIGMISQQFNLVKRSTVQKNVLSGKLGSYSTLRSVLGIFSRKDYELCTQVLEKVNLSDKLHERCDNLSGGQQQRVSIARALVKRPQLIFADEPTAALDYTTSIEVLSVLEKIKKSGTTLIVVTHNEEITRMADRIIRFKGGRSYETIVNARPVKATELEW